MSRLLLCAITCVAFAATAGARQSIDVTGPKIAISSPTALPTYSTIQPDVELGGSAFDELGVTQVTWANDRGGSGTAIVSAGSGGISAGSGGGTVSWFTPAIALQPGVNVLTATARDPSGNSGSATLTATYTPPSDTDPLLDAQWHLRPRPQETAGASVIGAWSHATGIGVTIGIVDDGLQHTHPDLSQNFVSPLSSTSSATTPIRLPWRQRVMALPSPGLRRRAATTPLAWPALRSGPAWPACGCSAAWSATRSRRRPWRTNRAPSTSAATRGDPPTPAAR